MAGTKGRDLVRFELQGSVALLTLDNPPVNVLSREMLEAIEQRLHQAEGDPRARVVVLASALERAFAAGANIREMAPMDSEKARDHGGRGQAITVAIERLPLPVVAAVNGSCLGGGTEIALACDFVFASEDATFGQPEINLGVMPGWGGTRRLPRRIGAVRARRWILLGEPVNAHQARLDGFVDRVVKREELLPEALKLGDELARRPPLSLAAAKYSINHSLDPDSFEGLAYELDLWAALFDTEDQKEGMTAFLEKRTPRFTDREQFAQQSAGFPWARGSSVSAEKRKK